MNIAILILGIVETIICSVCFFFKKQYQFLLCLLGYNIILLIEYLLQSYYLETMLVVISIIKTIIFYIYAKKNLKPNIYFICIFEVSLIVTSILMWQNWFSIFLLISSMLSTFASWQKNMTFLRISICFCSILLIINYAFTGLYTTIIAEGITFIFALISIFMYDITPNFISKKETTIINPTIEAPNQQTTNQQSTNLN